MNWNLVFLCLLHPPEPSYFHNFYLVRSVVHNHSYSIEADVLDDDNKFYHTAEEDKRN